LQTSAKLFYFTCNHLFTDIWGNCQFRL